MSSKRTAFSSSASADLVFPAFDRGLRTILMSASVRGEGCTTSSILLARSLVSNFGAKVLLVDLNLRRPEIYDLAGFPVAPGLTDLLNHPESPVEKIVHAKEKNLHVLTSGAASDSALRNMSSGKFGEILSALANQYDHVVCDSPPLGEFPELFAVARLFDGVILVLECARTRWEVAQSAKERLEAAGARVVGAVLNKRRYYIPASLYRKI